MAKSILSPRALRAMRSAGLVVVLGAGVTACATTQTRYPLADMGPSQPNASAGGQLHGTEKPYQVNGQWYYPQADPNYDQVGFASWYGYPFEARHTADGELFDQTLISAAHKTLPLPCIVEVTNLENGRTLRVRVNDRGPFVDGRLIDLSKAAAEKLGFDRQGVTKVRVRYISPAPPLTPGMMLADNRAVSTYSPPPAASVDGFDEIERADPNGHIYPTPWYIGREQALAAASQTTYRPHSIPNADITTAALPALPDSTPAAVSGSYAVQAGAFGSRLSADRAVAKLAMAGPASVSPIQRNGATLYRVTVGAFPDPDAAAVTKLKVIASGFSDAKVVQTF